MRLCNNCGNLNPEETSKCLNCGASALDAETKEQYSKKYYKKYIASQDEPSPKYKPIGTAYIRNPKQKSVIVLILLTLFSGTGLIYTGNKRKGITMFVVYLVVTVLYTMTMVSQIISLLPFSIAGYLAVLVWGVKATIEEIKIINASKKEFKQKQYSIRRSDYPMYKKA
ncbi:MAG: hypothetical protein ACTSQF_15395 [Candidatus Heimdallarchaeaceae archaeon]